MMWLWTIDLGLFHSRLNPIIKSTTTSTRHFHITKPTMSLFPRAFQEFSPIINLVNDYEKATRAISRDIFSDNDMAFFRPKFDVKETKDSYELHGELPGLEQKDVNIEWTDGNTLTISGRTEHRREEGTRPTAEEVSEKATNDKSDENTAVTTTQKAGEVGKPIEHETKYWVSERSVGEFRRNFSFPARVDQDAVKATLKNGVLSINVPKSKGGKTKKVAIE
jgi:HSP20 family molecular chaperone IbpA